MQKSQTVTACNILEDEDNLQQFTGFYDVTEKEVYEGDIVYNDDRKLHGLIYWDENLGMWRVRYDKKSNWSLSEVLDNLRPVVGNYYEHKHLLEFEGNLL